MRRHCAPVLDLPAHAPVDDYLARRAELGTAEVTRRMLRAAGTDTFLVDTGFRADELTGPAELAGLAGDPARGPATAYPIARLEAVADRLAGVGVEPGEFRDAFGTALADELAATGAVGLKSIAAYPGRSRPGPAPPGQTELAAAVASCPRPRRPGRSTGQPGDHPRAALGRGRVRPAHPAAHRLRGPGRPAAAQRPRPCCPTCCSALPPVPIMLLHCWPYQRQAGYLAAVWSQVHLDVGLTLGYVGPTRAAAVLAEAMELTPFGKLLYSSDAFGLPELYLLGAHTFRTALARLLDERVTAGEWAAVDTRRIAELACAENARRVYRLAAR